MYPGRVPDAPARPRRSARRRRWLDTGTRRKVDLESEALHERCELWVERSQDDLRLLQLFSPAFVAWLAEHPLHPCFEYRSGTLVVYLERRLEDAGHLGWMLDATAEIAGRLRARSRRRPARAPPTPRRRTLSRRGGDGRAARAGGRGPGARGDRVVPCLARDPVDRVLRGACRRRRARPGGPAAGPRWGYGASIAAMLQTVAIIGPVRFGVPLTQALTAPLLGVLEARGGRSPGRCSCAGRSAWSRTRSPRAFVILVLTGLDVYLDSYDTIAGVSRCCRRARPRRSS